MTRICLFIFLFVFQVILSWGQTSLHYTFRSISTEQGLPTNEVDYIYQDKDGYMWIATRSGLCQYDGYTVRTFKSNLYTPDLLNNNTIYSMCEDNRQQLWIGTYNGLNVLDKRTGKIRKIVHEELSESLISRILITHRGDILLGTERGIFSYDPETNECKLFLPGRLVKASVKALIEDSRKQIWIGMWEDGYHRYDPETDSLYTYPPASSKNAAYSLYEDSRGRMWIGTWDEGLCLLENPYDMDNLRFRRFLYHANNPQGIGDSYVYDISEDLNTGLIWAGTRNGLSILYNEEKGLFRNYLPDNSIYSISYNVVSCIQRDREGMMWLGFLGGGVNTVDTHVPEFKLNRLEDIKHRYIYSPSIRGLLVDRNGLIWLGLSNLGFLVYNRVTGEYIYNLDSKEFAHIGRIPTVNTIVQSPTTGKIWIGTYDWGIVEYDESAPSGKKARLINRDSDPWIGNQCVFAIREDRQGNTWFGFRNGISVLTPQGRGISLDTCRVENTALSLYAFVSIIEDAEGNMWGGTTNGGIIRIIGNPEKPEELVYHKYTPENGRLNSVSVHCLFTDKKGRLWAGLEGGGLNLYDPDSDSFIPVHREIGLPGDAVFSIQEDTRGHLWMGTNVGLIRLHIPDGIGSAVHRLYTTSDGLQDNVFNRNTAFTDINGEMFFGGHHGYNSFHPDRMVDEESFPPVVVTDIKIYNQSWHSLPEKQQSGISPVSPGFTESIRLDYRNNNFNIEFAALGYTNPLQIKYAYQLEGFDEGWQYTDASRRLAYYNNLKPGQYTFHLKATNANGMWNNAERRMQVTILPPPWKSDWAYLLYSLLLISAAYGIYRFVRYRLKLTQALHLAEVEQAKQEELNHSKLQFFTNITHELLTPLTIISASVDELRAVNPQNNEHYQVMTNNVNRLIRLLQQILEFRKAETGNLKLKVSPGDLAGFIRNSVESFRPLIKKKNIRFNYVSHPSEFTVYFDPDKVDKILYNLLSNAAKYNDQGCAVDIDLIYKEDLGCVILTVKDNGKGMSADVKDNLFKRFYEGDHRKFHTQGTGIGLSLTKDLIDLHHGTISVVSEPGKGTTFRVNLPVSRDSYSPEEIDESEITPLLLPVSGETTEKVEDKPVADENNPDSLRHSILLIEDNEDLLQLMVRLLSTDYTVHTAMTGKEGLEKMEHEEIDLVVSDIMMPEMDGISFCRYVKSTLNICHIPVILLTAKSREEDRVEAYESGADGFITKPFNLSVLHARITNLLRSKERTTRDFKKQLVFEANELNYTSMDEEFLQKAIDVVYQHLDNADFDQQQFLEVMGTSKSTLYRKIKSLTGLNTSAFIRNVRLKAACRIMEDKKNIRISELAYAVGFNDPKYFSVCFKREFGMQPSEYMERFVPGQGKG